MSKIAFTKMVASGNDFIVIAPGTEYRTLNELAIKLCDRKYGIGADGMLVLEKSRKADIRMRIFNADGSEAEMCGNGARCVALYINTEHRTPNTERTIETKAGIIRAHVKGNNIKIKLTEPKNIKLDLPINVNNRNLKVNFIDTGVPHTVIFSSGLEKIDVFNLGQLIRYHKKFAPRGTNVDFIEALGSNSVAIRTYERGVENETLACGTGSVASALIFALKSKAKDRVYVGTKSGETLSVYFKRIGNKLNDVWLEGKASSVFKGEFLN
jgi:diaminopimelate epimerase